MLDSNTYKQIHIRAKGQAPTRFVGADFTVKVTTQADFGPEAKAQAQARIALIHNVLQTWQGPAEIQADQLHTIFTVKTHHIYRNNANEFAGYQALYVLTFRAQNVAEAIGLHDALTSIPGIEAETPRFILDDSPEVQTAAFHDAAEKAQALFEGQAAALGFDTTHFKIRAWATLDEDRYRGGKTVSLGDEANKLVSPGRAVREMLVNFSYERMQ